MIEVTCIQCPKCKDTIYSRARHDFHSCSCGNYSIDGGFDYLKCSWKEGRPPKTFRKIIVPTKQNLYDDWNTREDKYGVIKEKFNVK